MLLLLIWIMALWLKANRLIENHSMIEKLKPMFMIILLNLKKNKKGYARNGRRQWIKHLNKNDMTRLKTWHIKVYSVEEYYKEAKTKKEAIDLVNLDGDPSIITTIKTTAKNVKEKGETK